MTVMCSTGDFMEADREATKAYLDVYKKYFPHMLMNFERYSTEQLVLWNRLKECLMPLDRQEIRNSEYES